VKNAIEWMMTDLIVRGFRGSFGGWIDVDKVKNHVLGHFSPSEKFGQEIEE
jgi:hypothetical protein